MNRISLALTIYSSKSQYLCLLTFQTPSESNKRKDELLSSKSYDNEHALTAKKCYSHWSSCVQCLVNKHGNPIALEFTLIYVSQITFTVTFSTNTFGQILKMLLRNQRRAKTRLRRKNVYIIREQVPNSRPVGQMWLSSSFYEACKSLKLC